jgi:uncharacterized coiled-coil protein SlyX
VAQDWRDQRIAELEAALRARDARIAEQDARIAVLEQHAAGLKEQVAKLLEKLGQNSQNSHRPPSTDSPADRKRPKDKAQDKGRGRRKRGAQLIEIPPIQPDVTELWRHEVECQCCQYKTRAAYDEAQSPASPFGSHASTCRSTAPLNSYRSAGRR